MITCYARPHGVAETYEEYMNRNAGKKQLTIEIPTSIHFYASSAATWVTGTDPEVLLKRIRKEDGNKFNHTLWYVPLPEDAAYKIEMYAPMVEGAIRLGTYTYE